MFKKTIISNNHLTHIKNELWILHVLSELNQDDTQTKINKDHTKIVN